MKKKNDEMEEIYKAHSKTVYRYLLSLSGSEQLAEELTQETFYRAVKNASRFDSSCKVTTWLCAIAKNVFLSELRKRKKTEELCELSAVCPSAEEQVLSGLGEIEFLRFLHKMNEPTREVMHLRLLGNLSFAEIGEIMGIGETNARVTYYRGKEKLRKELSKDERKA